MHRIFFWRRRACSPGHPQIRTRSSPESASCAAASRPDYPVHPVHPCSKIKASRSIVSLSTEGQTTKDQQKISMEGNDEPRMDTNSRRDELSLLQNSASGRLPGMATRGKKHKLCLLWFRPQFSPKSHPILKRDSVSCLVSASSCSSNSTTSLIRRIVQARAGPLSC